MSLIGSQTLSVASSTEFPPVGSEPAAAVSQFPGTPIRVHAVCLEPMRAAGLQVVFAQHPGIEVVIEPSEHDNGWLDPAVGLLIVGTQAGARTMDLIASIRAKRPDLPMIFMSPAAGDEAVLTVLNLGVKGFLHETATAQQVEEAIRLVAAGSIWAPRRILARLIDRLLDVRTLYTERRGPKFTAREHQVMELLLEGCANRDIAARLEIEERTVKVYVGRLMRKMGVQNRTALSMRAIEARRA